MKKLQYSCLQINSSITKTIERVDPPTEVNTKDLILPDYSDAKRRVMILEAYVCRYIVMFC